jgi:uncharacterized protein, PEP-CTERM system associated
MSVPVLMKRTAAAFCVAVSLASAPAFAAEFRLTPSLTLGEEYNDNLFQTSSRHSTEFVTRVQPTVALSATGGGFKTDLFYGLDYRHYAKGSRGDQFDHRAGMKGSLGFFDDFVHLDLSDSYSRVSSDLARDVTAESLVTNQTLQNNAVISPYLTWHLSGSSTLKTGYRYRDTRYWSGNGIDKTEHDGYAEWSRELTEGLVLSAAYSYAHLSSETNALNRQEVYAGLRYDYGTGNFLYGKLGYDWQSFHSGSNTGDPFWDAGAGRDFGFLTATAGTKVEYTEDPETLSTRNITHYATLGRAFSRGTMSFNASYSKYEKQQVLGHDVRRKVLLGLAGRYDLRQDLALLLSLSGDRLNGDLRGERPYHLVGGVGLDWTLSGRVVLGTNYTHISYRDHLDSAADSIEVNRVIVELRLTR